MKKSLVVLAALSFYGGGLYADTKLDTQVISATGFNDSLADVSYNLHVIDGDELRNRGYKDIKEAIKSLPGVDVTQSGIGESIDIRGQGDNVARHVKTYIDGILVTPEDTSHLNAPINTVGIDDIEQIEVIPGGGSVVYGSGAVGGVVNIITKAGLNKNYANVSLKGGSFSHKSTSAGAGYRFNDNFYANFGVNFIDEKGYQRADINKFLSTNVGLKTFLDRQSLAFDFGYMQSKTRNSFGLTKEEMNKDRRATGSGYDMSSMPPKLVKGEEQEEAKNTKKTFSLKYTNEINENILLNLMPYYSKFSFMDDSFIDKKMGIKVNSKFTYDIFTTHIGYEYLNNKGEREGSGASNYVKKQSHSIYALESMGFEMLDVDFGARYERASYDINRVGSKGEAIVDDKNKNAWAANLIFSKNISDDSKIYFKTERGYTLPGAFELTDKADGITYTTNNLKPESYMNYELGYKGLILEQFVGASLFYTQTKDEIFNNMTFVPRNGPKWTYENVAKTRRFGIEIFANQSFFDDELELYENFAYIDAKVKKDNIHPARNGEKIPQVSKFKATVGASYLLFDAFKLRGDYNYYSKSKWYFDDKFGKSKQAIPLSENDRKAYGILNLGFSYYPIKNLDVNFDIKNVLGEKYNLRCENDGKCNPTAKQSFYLELRYKF